MYAIRSKRTNRWFLGIDTHFGVGSSHHIRMDEQLPALFKTKEIARIEMLSNALKEHAYEIIEVNLEVKESENA